MYCISANLDQLIARSLYSPGEWKQHYTSAGQVWPNKMVKAFTDFNQADTEYRNMMSLKMAVTKTWLQSTDSKIE